MTTSTMFWEAEHAGAEFAARHNGVTIRWNAPTRADDVQLQIEMVDKAVKGHCRGLILAPDEPGALMVPVERALAAGVPTVVVGSALSLPAQKNLSYIVNDDAAIGSMAAQRAGEALRGRGEIAVVGIDPQSLSSLAMLRSFVSLVENRFPNIAIVERLAGADNDLDSELMVNQLLFSHPGLKAVVSFNEMGTVSAYGALKSRGLTGKVKVIGVQQNNGLVNALRLHQIDALIAENSYQMGLQAVELLTQRSPLSPRVIRLAPLLITSENVDAPAVRQYIAYHWTGDLN